KHKCAPRQDKIILFLACEDKLIYAGISIYNKGSSYTHGVILIRVPADKVQYSGGHGIHIHSNE
ncbi:hypothetical protein, partial [Klebsiella grimontii]|uniref:hypothetical protein n=1 Tax=Klebsiella grimontii TaxID=2058152 RepID=UPI0025A2A75D